MAGLRVVAQRLIQPDVGQRAVPGLCQAAKASSRKSQVMVHHLPQGEFVTMVRRYQVTFVP
jgi:hypothetical protein